MTTHQVVSAGWIREQHPKLIRDIAEIALRAVDDAVQDLAMDLTHTCDKFNETADCDQCLDTMDKIEEKVLKAVTDQMMGVDL